MCGIVGLHLRDPDLYPQLGRLLVTMLGGVADRGPDSAGVAVYGDRRRCPEGYTAVSLLGAPPDVPDALVTKAGATTVVAAPLPLDDLLAAVDGARVVGSGTGSARRLYHFAGGNTY
jgi:methylamine---glutamate N-methyltransferase subunit A